MHIGNSLFYHWLCHSCFLSHMVFSQYDHSLYCESKHHIDCDYKGDAFVNFFMIYLEIWSRRVFKSFPVLFSEFLLWHLHSLYYVKFLNIFISKAAVISWKNWRITFKIILSQSVAHNMLVFIFFQQYSLHVLWACISRCPQCV